MTTLITRPLKRLARRAGIDIRRVGPAANMADRRATMLRHHDISLVLDVGANAGQYAAELRRSGYVGEIRSFEPLSSAFEALKMNARRDPHWKVFNFAIGSEDGEAEIHIVGNSWSSSLLPMLDAHSLNLPESRYVAAERVSVRTLNTAVRPTLPVGDPKVLLKIDTQGYEDRVLMGAASVLPYVRLIEYELSLVPLYEGQWLFEKISTWLRSKGFRPVAFEPGFSDLKSGHCLQVDGIFARDEFIGSEIENFTADAETRPGALLPA